MFTLIGSKDAAEKLQYNVNYLNQLAKAGKIPAVKRGRVWMFDMDVVQKYLEEKNVQKLLS